VVTADALFTHRDVRAAVCPGGGDSLPPVKDNRPQQRSDVDAAFVAPTALSPTADR